MTAQNLNVSRETSEKLRMFAALVEKWTTRINLVSKPSVPELWERHIVDSAQLFDLAPVGGTWVDLGSGGGFPGIVIAILTAESETPHQVTLVESDQRKCTFLRTAARELELSVIVENKRIEALEGQNADILSARALADLSTLLGFCELHLSAGGTALFPKGAQWEKEDAEARKTWSYACEPVKSKTNPAAAILKIKDVVRV